MPEAVASREPARTRSADPQRSAASLGRRSARPARPGIDHLQRTLGNAGMHRLLRAGGIQPKLTVGPADDEYEREADRVADEVMRMPDPDATAAVQRSTLRVQRVCSKCEEEEEPCADCAKEHGVQTKRAGPFGDAAPASLESYVAGTRGGGNPLSPRARAHFEERFGQDFGQVRIHADARSARAAADINALAFAAGSDIHFGAGQFQPGTPYGDRLLAHELTHVRQQAGQELMVRTQHDDSAALGTGLQPLEIDDWKTELRKQGYTEFHSKADGFKGWAKDAFPDGRKRPDLIAVDHTGKKVLVGDVTAGPWSETDVKPGDKRPLPNDLGEAPPHRHGKGTPKAQKQAHEIKTKADARQAARKLPSGMQDYEVATQERYWKAKVKTSKRLVIKRQGTPSAPTPTGGSSKGAGRSGVRTGGGTGGGFKPTVGSRLGKAARSTGRGLKAVGRGVVKALPILAVLGPFLEVADALAQFDAAKAKVDELKRILDSAWAEYEKLVKGLAKGPAPAPTAPVPQPAQQPAPEPPRPEPVSRKQSVRVYDILRHRLRERSLEVETERLKTAYSSVSFTSLTDLDAFTLKIPSHQYDCPTVLSRGVAGVRQFYKFEGYCAGRGCRELKDLLPLQTKAIRLLCAAQALGKGAGRSKEPAATPDGDQITVYFDWVVGDLAENMSATCQGPDGAGNWECSHDGDLASLKRATNDSEPPEHTIIVELTRTSGGKQTKWTFTQSVDVPDPENPELMVSTEGSLPEDACESGRYPKGSALAYVLEHYSSSCQ